MSISPKYIQGKLVTKLQDLAKGKIWEYPNGTPAVLKANAFNSKTPPSPKMPFITVDFLQTLNPFLTPLFEGWVSATEMGVEVDEGVEDVFMLIETKVMQFTVTAYGSGQDDTLQIISEISSRLKMSHHRDYFKQYEVNFYDSTKPIPASLRLSDEYQDATTFTISFSYADRVFDLDGSGYFTTVNIDTDAVKDEKGFGGIYKTNPKILENPSEEIPLPIQTGDIP